MQTHAPVEPYGQVNPSSQQSADRPLQHRRRTQEGTSHADQNSNVDASAPYSLTDQRRTLKQPTAYPFSQSQTGAPHAQHLRFPHSHHVSQPLMQQNHQNDKKRKHDSAQQSHSLSTLLACLYCLVILLNLGSQTSPVPLRAILFVGLLLYAADLASVPRYSFLGALLLSFIGLAVTMVAVSAGALAPVSLMGNAMATIMTLLALALWILRHGVEWMAAPESLIAKQLQAALHAVLPPLCAAMTTLGISALSNIYNAASVAPLFALILAACMLWIGAAQTAHGNQTTDMRQSDSSSHYTYDASYDAGSDKGSALAKTSPVYCIPPSVARGHLLLLLILPPSLQIAIQFGNYWTLGFWYDLVIICGLSYILQFTMTLVRPSPYATAAAATTITVSPASTSPLPPITLKACAVPFAVMLVVCFAVQQRYLVALSQSFAHLYLGSKLPVHMTSIYWMISTIALLIAATLQVASSQSGEPLLGDYQEDAVQLALAIAGATIGRAFGLTWNFTPLPVLAVLGLALWLSTRLLRYLAVFLFVAHATGVVIFTYRFAGMDQMKLTLPIPGNSQLSILQFAYSIVWSSWLVGLAAGLSIRSHGGYLATFLKKWDATGLLLFVYTSALMLLEITLMKRAIPYYELAGIDQEAEDGADNGALYEHDAAILSSAVIVAVCAVALRQRRVSRYGGWAAIALNLGKAVAVYIDAAMVARGSKQQPGNGLRVCARSLVAAGLFIVLAIPHIFFEPVLLKATSRRQALSGVHAVAVPRRTTRKLFVYALCILPATLALAIPNVLLPLINVLNMQYRDDYVYSSRSSIPELFGGSIVLWSLACLSTLSRCLPDGGMEHWKKLCGLSFLFGVGIIFVAPTLGAGIDGISNPYAGMSSFGSRLVGRGRYRTGGWGLLSSAFATVLAVTGPLELKERAATFGRKDRFLLFRTMLFSLMFGGGAAWFIVLQSMRESSMATLVIVLSSSLAIAFLGTIAAVFGHFLPLAEFQEAGTMTNLWYMVLAALVAFSWVAEFFEAERVGLFTASGWLASILAVSSMTAFSMALSIRNRRAKNALTRSTSNMLTICSWCFTVALLFGRCGVAGMGADFETHTILGLPASVVGTLLTSVILLLLEGEAMDRKSTKGAGSASIDGISLFTFPHLRRSNIWTAYYFGCAFIMLLASVYSIVLRGAGFFPFLDAPVARTHHKVLQRLFQEETEGVSERLAELVSKNILYKNAASSSSARLAESSVWTATNLLGPLLHLIGLATLLPSLFLLYMKEVKGRRGASAQVALALPFTLISVLFCAGIPSLRVAGLISFSGGLYHAVWQRRAHSESMMRI